MKKILTIATLSLASLVLIACSQNNDKTPLKESDLEQTQVSTTPDQTPPATVDGAETSLDWAGEYTGTFPCASCEGIKIKLKLNPNHTYELDEEYLGTPTKNESEVTGSFSFDTKNPSIITLDETADHRKFFIGENFVEAREPETGNKIESKLNYKLTK